MPSGPLLRYKDLVASGRLEPDAAQLAAAHALDQLANELRRWKPASSSLLARFRSNGVAPPNGLYVHGAVGRGKTMLMDLFFEEVVFSPRRRLHFHEFMAETHDLIAAARATTEGDPIPAVARRIAKRAQLLCFDELHVTDIADAMILGRLFEGLFQNQVVIVCTSNVPPSGLYRGGLNRQLFLPFLDLIERHMTVIELAAAKDFRLDKLAGRQLYFAPADENAREAAPRRFQASDRPTRGPAAGPGDQGTQARRSRGGHGGRPLSVLGYCARSLSAPSTISTSPTPSTPC